MNFNIKVLQKCHIYLGNHCIIFNQTVYSNKHYQNTDNQQCDFFREKKNQSNYNGQVDPVNDIFFKKDFREHSFPEFVSSHPYARNL